MDKAAAQQVLADNGLASDFVVTAAENGIISVAILSPRGPIVFDDFEGDEDFIGWATADYDGADA